MSAAVATTVLTVEDDPIVRADLRLVLEDAGFEVSDARNGAEAIDAAAREQPDLMLLDIEMPRMDGYEVATRMRADERLRGVPIIMITSRVGEKHRSRAIELGVDDYLGKPYQESQLLDAIAPLVAHRFESLGLPPPA